MDQQTISSQLQKPVDQSDHCQGPEFALVTLVEYGDYQCEDTLAARPVVKELQERFGDCLKFVFRNYPITERHKQAQGAAEAAEAAASQGLFWDMHQSLFLRQKELSDHVLSECAEEIGLDLDRFEWEMAEHACAGRVTGDIRSGKRSGVEQTPTFFINGVKYTGPVTVEDMCVAIEDMEMEH